MRKHLGTLMIWKGATPNAYAMLYRAVTQEILMFGADTWAILVAMERKVEVKHTCFLQQITGKKESDGQQTVHGR